MVKSGYNMCSLAIESKYVTTELKNDFCSAPWSPIATLIHPRPFPSMTTPCSRRGSFNSVVSSMWIFIFCLTVHINLTIESFLVYF